MICKVIRTWVLEAITDEEIAKQCISEEKHVEVNLHLGDNFYVAMNDPHWIIHTSN